nr:putative tripeptidylaminopeptidase [Streptomyces sp.]
MTTRETPPDTGPGPNANAAGENALSAFHEQRPQWAPAPPGGGAASAWLPAAAPTHAPVEHAVVEVPMDYSDPAGRRLSIAVSRLRAKDPARRRGILLLVNGGPGGYFGLGRGFPAALAHTGLTEVYDLIGFDPRGTGDSTPLRGEITPTAAPFDSRPPDSAFAVISEDFRIREEGNLRAGGELRPHVSTPNTARDMDVIRAVLGEDRLNYLGYTYGTYLGAVYGALFPDRLDRSVLDSCVHPDWSWREQAMAQGRANRDNVEAWAAWAARRDGHFGLGSSGEQVLATVEAAAAAITATPGAVPLRSLFDGAMGNRSADRSKWRELADLVADVRTGGAEAAGKWLANEKVWPPSETEGETRCGVLDAVTVEKDWPADLEVYYEDMRRFREHFPYGYGVMRAQTWVGAFRTFTPPERPVELSARGYPAGLVVHAEGDPTDHYEGGAAMAARLGHRLITVADSGQHEIYGFVRNPDVDRLVEGYLVDGVLPDDTSCPSTVSRPDVPADGGTGSISREQRKES